MDELDPPRPSQPGLRAGPVVPELESGRSVVSVGHEGLRTVERWTGQPRLPTGALVSHLYSPVTGKTTSVDISAFNFSTMRTSSVVDSSSWSSVNRGFVVFSGWRMQFLM